MANTSKNEKKPVVLNINEATKFFARLTAGDPTVCASLVKRAQKNNCDEIHVPRGVHAHMVSLLTVAANEAGNVTVKESNAKPVAGVDVRQAFAYMVEHNITSIETKLRESRQHKPGKKAGLTPSQIQAKKAERSAKSQAERSNMKGLCPKKD